MVGDQEGARHGMTQVGLDLDAQRIKQSRRPARLETQTARFAEAGAKQQRDQQPGKKQQGDAAQAPAEEEKWASIQAACPT